MENNITTELLNKLSVKDVPETKSNIDALTYCKDCLDYLRKSADTSIWNACRERYDDRYGRMDSRPDMYVQKTKFGKVEVDFSEINSTQATMHSIPTEPRISVYFRDKRDNSILSFTSTVRNQYDPRSQHELRPVTVSVKGERLAEQEAQQVLNSIPIVAMMKEVFDGMRQAKEKNVEQTQQHIAERNNSVKEILGDNIYQENNSSILSKIRDFKNKFMGTSNQKSNKPGH